MPDEPIALMVIAGADVRADLVARLSGRPDCVVVAEGAGDGDVAAAAADADVIVWDLGEEPGVALARFAGIRPLNVPVVTIAAEEADGTRALAAGATGVLAAGIDADWIVLAARAAEAGLLTLDPSVAGAAVAARDPEGDAPVEALTPREREVLALMGEGLSNRLIAERLGISEHTAKFHVHTILGKLGTQSRTEAVVRAARLGLVAI